MRFESLNFKPAQSGAGVRARVRFANGYGASVIKGPYTYGGDRGLYELAVLGPDGSLNYDTPITSDVLGHLEPGEVTAALKAISELDGGGREDGPE